MRAPLCSLVFVATLCAIGGMAVELEKIHLVYMTHLDLGFTDTTRNVCDRYFDLYFPQAFKLSSDLRKSCKTETCPVFRWTQFPWLIQASEIIMPVNRSSQKSTCRNTLTVRQGARTVGGRQMRFRLWRKPSRTTTSSGMPTL